MDSAIYREQMKLGAVQTATNILMNSMRRLRGERAVIDIDAVVRRCYFRWRQQVRLAKWHTCCTCLCGISFAVLIALAFALLQVLGVSSS